MSVASSISSSWLMVPLLFLSLYYRWIFLLSFHLWKILDKSNSQYFKQPLSQYLFSLPFLLLETCFELIILWCKQPVCGFYLEMQSLGLLDSSMASLCFFSSGESFENSVGFFFIKLELITIYKINRYIRLSPEVFRTVLSR